MTATWYDEWAARHGQSLPASLPRHETWANPHLQYPLAGAMHEDSGSTDVSNLPGPVPANSRVQYFHVLEKGKRLSGMAPFFTFPDEETVLTISFGRDIEVSAFSGVGYTSDDVPLFTNPDSIYNFGVGGRYNIFESHNIWIGLDIARGPEDWYGYIQVGHPW